MTLFGKWKLPFVAAGAGMFVYLAAAGMVATAGRAENSVSGKELFEERCGGCHALDRDKEGPRLHGVYGRAAGAVDSFPYSDALKKSKIVWAEDTLDRWLTNTDDVVPNNDMTFHVEKSDERQAIIAFLKQDSGK